MAVVDFKRPGAAAGQEEDEETRAPEINEPSMLDPRDGTVIPLKPGETMLLRFSFTNEQRTDRTYVIEEDRSLGTDWIRMVQDQVNITPNGSAEVVVRLTPPLGSQPGDYPFEVRIGPLGGVLTPRYYTLSVQATPAVGLKAKQATVSAGPFARYVDFGLSVEYAGNAETAFRVSVKAPESEDGEPNKGPGDIYETQQWRYLFDKEMENLLSANSLPPQPEPVRLRLLRRGIWWFGFKEKHKVKVAAVPVTDPTNGGKPGNTLELTGVRWRLTPIPAPLLALILLFAFWVLNSSPSNLHVANALVSDQGVYYVIGENTEGVENTSTQVALNPRLAWDAPFYAMLTLRATSDLKDWTPYRAGGGSFTDTDFKVANYGNTTVRTYRVGPTIGFGGAEVQVRPVPRRTNRALQLSSGGRRLEELEYSGPNLTDEKLSAESGCTVELPVPTDGSTWAHLDMLNKKAGYVVYVTLIRKPNTDDYETDVLLPDEPKNADVGVPLPLKIRAKNPSAQPSELVLVTTDKGHQVIHVKLVPSGGGSGQ